MDLLNFQIVISVLQNTMDTQIVKVFFNLRILQNLQNTSLKMSYFSDCECNMDGSVDNSCDINTGKCTCKPNVSGDKCDESTEGYFGFPGEPQGMKYYTESNFSFLKYK